jgi:hypothetical protein
MFDNTIFDFRPDFVIANDPDILLLSRAHWPSVDEPPHLPRSGQAPW